MAGLLLAVQVGDRSLPLAGRVEALAANLGFAGQPLRRERVRGWLPLAAAGLLFGDRFSPCAEGFHRLHPHRWQSRRRLTGNLTVDPGSCEATTGERSQGVSERDLSAVRLVTRGVPTPLGILQEAGHQAPWIMAMDCQPTPAAGRASGARWAIEPLFSDFQSRGFQLEESPLRVPDRRERRRRIMALARDGWVGVGRHDARYHPTPLEKTPSRQPLPTRGASNRSGVASCPGSNAVYFYC